MKAEYLAFRGALGGGNFKSEEQRKSQEGRKMGEASQVSHRPSLDVTFKNKFFNLKLMTVAALL